MHVEKPSKNLQQQLTKRLSIPKAARLILFAPEVRSRCVRVESGYILIVHGVQPSTMIGADDFPTLRFWITKNSILSITTGKIDAVHELQKDMKDIAEPNHMVCFTYLLEYIISYLEDSIYHLDEKLTKVESNFEYTEEATADIMSIRQDVIFLRRYIFPQKDALINLSNKLDFVSDTIKSTLKELSDSMLRQVEAIEMLRERAVIIQDNLTNQIGELANRRMYLLTIIMLIFTPAFFIVSLFSMYVPMPGMDSHLTWWIVDAVIIVVSYGLYKLFKIKNWL
jgi:zinc transporter